MADSEFLREPPATLLLPGLHGSGPGHWQSLWQASNPRLTRVEQFDWDTPDIDVWASTIVQAVRHQRQQVVLVAHSFACLAALRASLVIDRQIAGALLVAPADPDKFGVEPLLPHAALPFPSIVVASRNDPWMSFEKAARWAQLWDSNLVDLGNAGHINAEAGYGVWPKGEELLRELYLSLMVVSFESLTAES